MEYEQWCKEKTDIGGLAKSLKSSVPEQYVGFYVSQVFDDVEYQKQFDWLGKASLDLFIPSLKLAIEYDGYYYHTDKRTIDMAKSSLCRSYGIRIIRIVEQDNKHIDEIQKYKKDAVDYFCEKDYSNICVAIEQLFLLICKRYNLSVSPNVDLKRDEMEILRYVQRKYYERTIAYAWPETKEYWDDHANGKSIFDVFCTDTQQYVLKCPRCGKNFDLHMRYCHERKSLIPCECEYVDIERELIALVNECLVNGNSITFDNSLRSRRIFDLIPSRIMLEGEKLSDEELILYQKAGVQYNWSRYNWLDYHLSKRGIIVT